MERQLQKPYLARWCRKADEALLERSGRVLAAAAAGPSYLSEDFVFRERWTHCNLVLNRCARGLRRTLGPGGGIR